MNRAIFALVACMACAEKPARTAAEERARAPSPPAAAAETAPSAGELSAEEQGRFLDALNELCADTYCEGAFGFEFDGLECLFAEEACVVSFVMFTDEPTRPGLVPTRIGTDPDAEEAFQAEIESVVPPPECDSEDVGMTARKPCTIVEASCVLSPIRSVAEFEDVHWDMLSHCVFGLEDAILLDSAPAERDSASAEQ